MRTGCFLCLLVLILLSKTLYASNWTYAGNIKLQSSETLFEKDDAATIENKRLQHSHIVSTRLMTRYQRQDFTFDLHYDLKTHYSTLNKAASVSGIESRKIFSLQQDIIDRSNLLLAHRIDRLLLTYAKDKGVLRLGRQAISWGNGFLFNPLDFFNPFSQTAIDKDYKPGDDMLYTQWLMDSGNDWQWVFVPRRDKISDDITMSQSSIAMKYKSFTNVVEMDYLIAQHYNETLLGLGIVKSVRESIWRLDVTATKLEDNKLAIMLVSNIDYSWVLSNHNMLGYVEYFYNSIGINSYQDLVQSQLLPRIERRELFTFGRQYIAVGLTIETSPLTNLSSNVIFNMHDKSLLIPMSFNYNWKQNINLAIGANISFGKRDTEFGGYKLPNGNYAGAGQNIYGLIAYYF